MDNQEIEDLDLKPNEVQVRLSGVLYVVKEASADVGKKFRNMVTKACRMEGTKLVGLGDGLGDVEPALVAGCLFRRNIASDGKTTDGPVLLTEILKWPDRVQKRLAEIAKSISKLEDEKPEKNESASDGDQSSLSLATSESTSTS